MITLKIEPIETTTKNGTPARVTGIEMASGAPFVGTIEYEPGKHREAQWRAAGLVLYLNPLWNLDLGKPELEGLREAAQRLRAQM